MVELIVIFQGKPKQCEKVLAFNSMNGVLSIDCIYRIWDFKIWFFWIVTYVLFNAFGFVEMVTMIYALYLCYSV